MPRTSPELTARPAAADPMAQHKQRARWRLLGALIFATGTTILAMSVLRQEPRSLQQDLLIRMPSPSAVGADAPQPGVPALPETRSQAIKPPAEPQADAGSEVGAAAPITPAPAPTPVPPVAAAAGAAAGTASGTAVAAAAAPSPAKTHLVQVGAYASRGAAEAIQKKLAGTYPSIAISPIQTAQGQRFRVRIGPMDLKSAEALRDRLKKQGHEPALVKVGR